MAQLRPGTKKLLHFSRLDRQARKKRGVSKFHPKVQQDRKAEAADLRYLRKAEGGKNVRKLLKSI